MGASNMALRNGTWFQRAECCSTEAAFSHRISWKFTWKGRRRRPIFLRSSTDGSHALSGSSSSGNGSSNGELIQLMTKSAMAAFIGTTAKLDSSRNVVTEAVAGGNLGVSLDDSLLLSVGDEVGRWWVDSGGRLPSLERLLLEAQWSFKQEVQWLVKEDAGVPEDEEVGTSTDMSDPEKVTRSGNPSARSRRLAKRRCEEKRVFNPSVVSPTRKPILKNAPNDGKPQSFMDAYLQHAKSHTKLSDEEQMALWGILWSTRELRLHRVRLHKKLGYEPSAHVLAEETGMAIRDVTMKLREGDHAKTELMLLNMKLVVSVAKQYQHMGVEMADLVQEGTFGLSQAVDKFDSSRGHRFSTYAYWWIFQAMIRTLDRQGKAVTIPFHVCESVRRINRLKAKSTELVTVETVMKELKFPRAKAERALVASHYKLISSQFRINHMTRDLEEGTVLEDLIADRNVDNQPWHEVERMQVKEQLKKLVMTKLEPREQEVIRKRFGLDHQSTLRLSRSEIGQSCGLSRERVRQLENSALKKLRAHKLSLSLDFLQEPSFNEGLM